MLALLASVLLVAFVIVPGVVFRLVFSYFVPLRAFDRTRTVEIAFSVASCALPFLFALFLVHHTCLGQWPFSFPDTWAQGEADYKTIFLSCFSDSFASTRDELWGAAVRATSRLSRLLLWYTGLVGVEAAVVGGIASQWGTLQPKVAAIPWLDDLATRLLLRNISEWHVLLTNFLFPGTTMHVDVLTVEDRLYQGDVLNYARDTDGNLTGIYLDNAQRYDRAGLLDDRAKGKAKPNTSEYWKALESRHLFIFADKIATLNVRPRTTLEAAERLAQEIDPAAKVTIKPVEEQASTGVPRPSDAGVSIHDPASVGEPPNS